MLLEILPCSLHKSPLLLTAYNISGTDRIENTAPLLQCNCCHGIFAFVYVCGPNT
jgi:hypothetical protein